MENDFDVIVVGAGPAGSVAAYCMASAGLNVLVVERGNFPGAKNLTGGRLYAHALEKIMPGFAKEAPVERPVTREVLTFLTESSAVSVDVASDKFRSTPSYTVLRAEFDPWLAGKAESAGASVVPGIRVDAPIIEGGKVVGVRCGDDYMGANVVIAADGVNSLIAQRAGLRKELDPSDVATGVKCIIELPAGAVGERFNVGDDQGVARMFVGDCTKGLAGGGFLYTNKNSVALGLVVSAHELASSNYQLINLIESFRLHSQLAELLEGGTIVEYSAHLIPEGGLKMVGTPYSDGLLVVGDAAGLVLNSGYAVRGMDFAIASGQAAANAVISAAERSDFSGASLSRYADDLKNSFVMKDLETFKRVPEFLTNHRVYADYPALVEELATSVFGVDGTERVPLRKLAMGAVKSHGGVLGIGKDVWRGMRAL